jgi:hypothetical protein
MKFERGDQVMVARPERRHTHMLGAIGTVINVPKKGPKRIEVNFGISGRGVFAPSELDLWKKTN